MRKVLFDVPRRERLRERYYQAVKNGEEQFLFESMPLDTQYAKYLLEYLDKAL